MSAKAIPPNPATIASWSTAPTYNPLAKDEPAAKVAYPVTAPRPAHALSRKPGSVGETLAAVPGAASQRPGSGRCDVACRGIG